VAAVSERLPAGDHGGKFLLNRLLRGRAGGGKIVQSEKWGQEWWVAKLVFTGRFASASQACAPADWA